MMQLLICQKCSLRHTEPRTLCTCGGPLETPAQQAQRLHAEELTETAFTRGCVPGSIRFPPSLDDADAAADEQHLEDVCLAIALTKEIRARLAEGRAQTTPFGRFSAAQLCRRLRAERRTYMDRIALYAVNRVFKYVGMSNGH